MERDNDAAQLVFLDGGPADHGCRAKGDTRAHGSTPCGIGTPDFYPGRTIYDEHYYEPVIAEFIRLADVREEERRVLLARYYPPDEPDRHPRRNSEWISPYGRWVAFAGAGERGDARRNNSHSDMSSMARRQRPGVATVNGQTQETALPAGHQGNRQDQRRPAPAAGRHGERRAAQDQYPAGGNR
jgi:hypothetical protein